MSRAEPAFSVVVPTRDRPRALTACLTALERQRGPAFEIVVVDDCSTDAAAVATVVAGVPRARLVRGTGRGPAAARNLGARVARAPWLCFTDDDCRPDPGWLEALATCLDGGAPVVAGRTQNEQTHDAFTAAAQTITNHVMDASYDTATGHLGFAPTCNLACTVEVHRSLPFDERYPLAAGEDREWCARLAASGLWIEYQPAATVTHAPDLSFARFWRQQVRYGRGAYQYRSATPGQARLEPVAFYVDLLRAAFAQGPHVGSLVLLAQVATATGVVREAWG